MRESAPCLGLYFFARAEVVCKADGRVRRFVGLHGINKETADGDVDDDGVPLGALPEHKGRTS